MDDRFDRMQTWLSRLSILTNTGFSTPESASSDASFRRYFRINLREPAASEASSLHSQKSLIIMDAPPEHEDCTAFISIAKSFKGIGLNVPVVLAENLAEGFLLLTDLGSQTYLSVLNDQNADGLYRDALSALVTLQTKDAQLADTLPDYSRELITSEMSLFDDWLGKEFLGVSMDNLQTSAWKDLQASLKQSIVRQPKTVVHRDYHSRNLMFLEQGNPGILDFQDAVKGPLTYDAVSLLRDCYITWPAERIEEWQREYFLMLTQKGQLTKDEWQGFQQSMDLMGIQRHLKAAGIFARLSIRDGKTNYIDDIPATLMHILNVAVHYPEMKFLVDWIENVLYAKLQAIGKS